MTIWCEDPVDVLPKDDEDRPLDSLASGGSDFHIMSTHVPLASNGLPDVFKKFEN